MGDGWLTVSPLPTRGDNGREFAGELPLEQRPLTALATCALFVKTCSKVQHARGLAGQCVCGSTNVPASGFLCV